MISTADGAATVAYIVVPADPVPVKINPGDINVDPAYA
jgi:hypothetical protein